MEVKCTRGKEGRIGCWVIGQCGELGGGKGLEGGSMGLSKMVNVVGQALTGWVGDVWWKSGRI